MRDFDWKHPLWAVIKDDGTFAGVPCLSYEEARDLASGHPGSRIFAMGLDPDGTSATWEYGEDADRDPFSDDYYEEDIEVGFDPYMGSYSYDC